MTEETNLMREDPIRVLLVEDNPLEVAFLRADFRRKGAVEFDLIAVQCLSEAIGALREKQIHVIVLDLCLQETQGLQTLELVRLAAPEVPIVVLSGLDDEALAFQALKEGAQDYLIKGNVNSHVLFRAIRYAIERKQVEAERRHIEKRLLQGQKLEAIGTLAGGVAHNFNNALMVILGHCNLMLEDSSQGGDTKNLEAIKKAAHRAAALTRQLLMFSKKQQLDMTLAGLNKVVTDIQVLIESMLDDSFNLVLELDSNAGLIKVAPSLIQQAILSLVLNARDAMENGGQITIKTERSPTAPDAAVLTIEDTGSGMSPEVCAHAFEPFFTTKGLTQASGLGLSTVYGIVEQHGGNIQVSSELGSGTTFRIAFPSCSSTTVPISLYDMNAVKTL